MVGNDFAFTRFCSNSIFGPGQSGYMQIPSESSHNNWKSSLYVLAKGIEIKLIPVAGFSKGFFLIAETETTKSLYETVLGTNSESRIPTYDKDTYFVLKFISALSSITGLSFSLPFEDEWIYAAKGGIYSQGFVYSGSNVLGDVAWYSSNSSNKYHAVKLKAPNELGIYDMSGNVSELVCRSSNTNNYAFGEEV